MKYKEIKEERIKHGIYSGSANSLPTSTPQAPLEISTINDPFAGFKIKTQVFYLAHTQTFTMCFLRLTQNLHNVFSKAHTKNLKLCVLMAYTKTQIPSVS